MAAGGGGWVGVGGGGRGRAIKFIQNLRAVNLAETSNVSMQICLLSERYRTIMVLLFQNTRMDSKNTKLDFIEKKVRTKHTLETV